MIQQYEFNHAEAMEELSSYEGYDSSYTLIYYNYWSEFESAGWLAIFERDNLYFKCNGGYNPGEGVEHYAMDYEPISLEDAIAEINEMEQECLEAAKYYSL